jgi:hypothetical protein
MPARRSPCSCWPCACSPIPALGRFAGGKKIAYLLHGPSCDRPLERRQTIAYDVTKDRAA